MSMVLFRKKPIKATRSLKSLHNQAIFLKRLGQLLLEGLSMQEALRFLSTTGNQEIKQWVNHVQAGFSQGRTLDEMLGELNFSDQVASQIYFSLVHGQFAQTISDCGQQMMDRMERKKKLQQILTYPIMLIIFIIGMLFAMRYILLPHLTQLTTSETNHMNLGTRLIFIFIRESPILLILATCLASLALLVFQYYLSKKTALARASILCQLPLARLVLPLYYTQFLAMEWGQLLNHGSNLLEITQIMTTDKNTNLVKELGQAIAQGMQAGQSFKTSISGYSFLKYELRDIIDYGEESSDLGKELLLYSRQCQEELSLKVEKIMTLVQPLVFIGIGILIVSIYAALLLPTFSLLNGL